MKPILIHIPTNNQLTVDALLRSLVVAGVGDVADVLVDLTGKEEMYREIQRRMKAYADDDWITVGSAPGSGLAKLWNSACQEGYDQTLLLNDDVLLMNPRLVLELCLEWKEYGFVTFSGINVRENAMENVGFSCVAISNDAYEKIGPFDEGFKGVYVSDVDFFRRGELAGVEEMLCQDSSLIVHFRSATLHSMPEPDRQEIQIQQVRDLDLYSQKWGGVPGREKFSEPFDGKKEK